MKNIVDETPQISYTSIGNSTTNLLGNGETFIGLWEDITPFASISIIITTDQIGTLFGQFSTDSVNIDREIQLSDGVTILDTIHTLISVSNYFRIKIVNGSTPQTVMRTQVMYYLHSRISQPTSRLAQNIGDYSDVLNTRSVIVSKNFDDDYINIGANDDNELLVNTGIEKFFRTKYINYDKENINNQLLNQKTNKRGNSTFTSSNRIAILNSGTGNVQGISFATQLFTNNLIFRQSVNYITEFIVQFDTPVALTVQNVSITDSIDTISIGYNSGGVFALETTTDGAKALYELTINTASSGVETATITLNGVPYVITLTNAAGDTSFTAWEVGDGGTGSLDWPVTSGYTINVRENIVLFEQQVVGSGFNGTYTFASTGTATGTFVQLTAGVDGTTTSFIESQWDHSPNNFNPLEFNCYRFVNSSCYIDIFILENLTRMRKIKRISKFIGTRRIVDNLNPACASLAITGASSSVDLNILGMSESYDQDQPRVTSPLTSFNVSRTIASSTETVLLAIRVDNFFNNLPTLNKINILKLSASSDGTKPVTINIIQNPTTLGAGVNTDYPEFKANDKDNSLLFTASGTGLTSRTGGIIIESIILSKVDSVQINFTDIQILVASDTVIAITAESSNTSDIVLSVLMSEEF